MPTFKYLTCNIIDALVMYEKEKRNVPLGGFSCAVMEFLGRCIRNSSGHQGQDNFRQFIEDFLSQYDERYMKYHALLYKDLRHGAAHSVLPKGGVTLSFDSNSEPLHLQMVKNKTGGTYHLWLYTPRFITDLRQAIFAFVRAARHDEALARNYTRTLSSIQQEGQDLIRELVPQEDLARARQVAMEGDISI